MLMLARLLAVVGAEEELCRLVLPLLTDTLAANVGDSSAEASLIFLGMFCVCVFCINRWQPT